MEYETLFQGSKWEILELLAKKPRSNKELAEEIGTSQANISQQTRQLELAKIISKKRSKKSGSHYLYHIPEELTYLIHLTPEIAIKKELKKTSKEHLLTTLFLHKHNIQLTTLILGKPKLSNRFQAIGIHSRSQPEIFIIAEKVDDIRKEHSSIKIETISGEATIAIWSHTEQEIQEGIDRKDQYFIKSLQELTVAYDPSNKLRKYKEQVEGRT